MSQRRPQRPKHVSKRMAEEMNAICDIVGDGGVAFLSPDELDVLFARVASATRVYRKTNPATRHNIPGQVLRALLVLAKLRGGPLQSDSKQAVRDDCSDSKPLPPQHE